MNWEAISREYEEFLALLSQPDLDHKRRAEVQKKASLYSNLLAKHKDIVELETSIQELAELSLEEGDMRDLYLEEIEIQKKNLRQVQKELEDILYPSDERDSRSVFLEIRAGAGGQEAALFALDLFKMYSMYAQVKGWTISIVDSSVNDLGGYKELVVFIKGEDVFKHLKFESGVHRVQRVPQTETQGRVHTSTVTVAVLPEAQEVDITINPGDLRIDVYRSSGAGGQHVNTTDSAVRITHIPSGLVVTCQDERSQIKNRAKAMKVLQARLYEMEQRKLEEERSAQRKQQVGTGERAEKIRTYNFPQNRVTDHRIDLTLKKLDLVLQGDFDSVVEPLIAWDREERRAHGSSIL